MRTLSLFEQLLERRHQDPHRRQWLGLQDGLDSLDAGGGLAGGRGSEDQFNGHGGLLSKVYKYVINYV